MTRSATPSWTLTWARTLMPKWLVVSPTADIPGRLDTDSRHLPSGLNQRRCVRLDWCFFAVKSRPGRPSTTRRWWETPSNASATTVRTKVKHRFSVRSHPSSSLSCCTDGGVMSVLSVCVQALITKPVTSWWPWSSSHLTSPRESTWTAWRTTLEQETRFSLKYLRQHSMRNNGNICVYNVCVQGLMFGYATDETEECMPLTVVLAHKLNAKMAELRRNGSVPWLRPDSKTQVESNAWVNLKRNIV